MNDLLRSPSARVSFLFLLFSIALAITYLGLQPEIIASLELTDLGDFGMILILASVPLALLSLLGLPQVWVWAFLLGMATLLANSYLGASDRVAFWIVQTAALGAVWLGTRRLALSVLRGTAGP
jgi:hypothetical protein